MSVAEYPPEESPDCGAFRRNSMKSPSILRFALVDYARYNENFVLVVTSSCCIR